MSAARELVVVKLGGTTLAEEHATLRGVVQGTERADLVLVHGGGRRLSDWLTRLGIASHFDEGRRVTDDDALEVALAVLGGMVNAELVAALLNLGVQAIGLSGIDGGLIRAERLPHLGRVGRVLAIKRSVIDGLLSAGLVPVIAPLALDEQGVICNVNADEAAGGLAAGLAARLILLTDTDGVMDSAGARLPELDEQRSVELIERGVIAGGMVPKVRGAIEALRSGAREVVIADGRAERALEHALAGDDFGTRVRVR